LTVAVIIPAGSVKEIYYRVLLRPIWIISLRQIDIDITSLVKRGAEKGGIDKGSLAEREGTQI
jgi:hypothetical protein